MVKPKEVDTSLATTVRATISRVLENTSPESSFPLSTCGQSPETDMFHEKFPALAVRHSLTTIQGLEWPRRRNTMKLTILPADLKIDL